MKQNRAASLIGLSMKAGKLASGEFAAEKAVKDMQAYLVVIAEDASENTRKKFRDMCSYRNIPWVSILTKEELGRAIGKEYRAVAAVTDANLAGAIRKQIDI